MVDQTRREFLKLGLAAAASAAMASGIEIPMFGSQNSSIQTQLNNANTKIANLNARVNTVVGFLSLSVAEQSLLEKIVETIIPTDADPGAKEAGVIYFIDRALAGDYGQSANMFMDGPHILPRIPASATTPLSVNPTLSWATNPYIPGASTSPISYIGGGVATPGSGTQGITASPRVGSGINYQYPLNMREFWRVGLVALQAYANSAYGGNFETLSSANQLLLLQDLWANKPSSFSNILPSDFAYELVFMTWAGFLMDPIYGGNQNMVGWTYTGFNGVNFGNFYGEGQDQKALMVATTPTRLKPASLAQYQQQASGGA
ncbi:gluconate 2-dehydrogenase subunit 3 family protein [Candidatus Bathyarchaeota archaeon]|nr:MAG: gluconate 2-dehydrogenase subunit 3 family protein [Candidatus Bathyarchaeota archaeon]